MKHLPIIQYGGGIFSTEAPSSQLTLACVKLTQNQPAQMRCGTARREERAHKRGDKSPIKLITDEKAEETKDTVLFALGVIQPSWSFSMGMTN